MNYKNMWEQLEKYVDGNIKYYKDGSMCSIQESIQGEKQWGEMKAKMEEIKKEDIDEVEDYIKTKGYNSNYPFCKELFAIIKLQENSQWLFIEDKNDGSYIGIELSDKIKKKLKSLI